MVFCLLVAGILASSADALGAWVPGNPVTAFTPQDAVVWTAPLGDGAEAFVVERRDGAEGEVVFAGGELKIKKTNRRGAFVIRPKQGYAVAPGEAVRASVDMSASASDPYASLGFVRVFGARESLGLDMRSENRVFGRGGLKMNVIACTPPGAWERKFAHFTPDAASGTNLTGAIVVSGAPSESVWRNWVVERFGGVQKRWQAEKARLKAKDFSADRVSDVRFAAALAEADHTARVVMRDGRVILEVDGRETPPVLYKSAGNTSAGSLSDGKAMSAVGIRLQVPTVRFDSSNPKFAAWKPEGFDARLAADYLEKEMRVAPDALYLVTLSLNPPPGFAEAHPGEIWCTADGRELYGEYSHIRGALKPGENPPKGTWRTISMHSESWRDAVLNNLTAFVAELKRRGLSRRVIGFHLAGSHDGQFATPYPDYSAASVRSFRRMLREKYATPEALSRAWGRPVAAFDEVRPPRFPRDAFLDPADRERRDFVDHLKRGPFRVLETIARHLKKEMGKDVVVGKWCLGVYFGKFEGAYDIGAFLASDAFDFLVTQPHYSRRLPGLPLGCRSPLASYRRHGKLFINEFDFRTEGAIERWAFTEASLCGDSRTADTATWQAVNRRAAGMMLARGMGFWYFDMAVGWFTPPGVRADLAAMMEDIRALPPAGDWAPSAALVVDEDGALLRNMVTHYDDGKACLALVEQVEMLAGSGVPFDVLQLADLLGDPTLAEKYRTLVFAEMHEVDAPRRKLLDALKRDGRTLVFLEGCGQCGGAEALGFSPVVSAVGNAGHETVPADGFPAEFCPSAAHAAACALQYGITNSAPSRYFRYPRTTVREEPGVKVVARYAEDGLPALAFRKGDGWKGVYVCDPGGLTPALLNALVRQSGGYVAARPGLQVDTNGRFFSLHCLQSGRYDLRLPDGRTVPLDLVAGETRWIVASQVSKIINKSKMEGSENQ